MDTWKAYPHLGEFDFDSTSIKRNWAHLHAGDKEPLPEHPRVLAAWADYHNGDFRKAFEAGMHSGAAGLCVANKATCIYANYVEPSEKARQNLYLEVADRAAALAKTHPEIASAHYWQAYALGRYSQSISVAKALAQGIGSKIKVALETTIQLEPRHAEAMLALGLFHAEVIDKVGVLIGSMTYGAKQDTSLKLFQQALLLTPKAPNAMMEYANALVMLEGDKRADDATQLYKKAAAIRPMDAKERLEVELATAALAD